MHLSAFLALAACQSPPLEKPNAAPEAPGPATADTADEHDTVDVETIDQGDCDEGYPAVVINEIVTANLESLTDASGRTPDWIELANLDEEEVSLQDWSLQAADASWTLPDVTLKPGAVLLVLASGEEESTADELHADFSLAADGEALSLRAPDGCRIDHLAPLQLLNDVSFGRPADSPESLGYFLSPTPGATNTTEARPGFAATPTLSPPPGFYDDPITVSAAGAGALWMTFDGSAPAGDALLYEEPIAVDAAEQPVVVRVRASAEGLWPSRIATATYSQSPEILEDGLKVVSLVVDPDDLYDEGTGIYTYGTPDYLPTYPYFGANFWEDWERDLHIEVFETDGTMVLAQDAGVKIHGGYTRAFEQKNFRLIARSGYGASTLPYAFFPSEDLDEFKIIVLEGVGDWCPTHTENAFVDALFRDEDGVRFPTIDTQAWEPAVVYLNGEFWGLYAFREKLDEHYIEAHHGYDADSLDRIECTADGTDDWWRVSQGDWEAFDALEAFLDTHELSEPDAWQAFTEQVDVDNLATAVIAEGYWGNADWWSNNLKLWRPRQEDGRWRWMVFDLGHGWSSYWMDHIGTSVSWSGKGLPIADALENEAFRILLANQAAELLSTSLSVEVALERFDAMHDRIEPVIAAQYDRWCGQPESYWHSLVSSARQFVLARTEIFREQVMSNLNLSGTATLTLQSQPPGAGSLKLTLIEVEPPFTGVFFTGVPVTVTAQPADGYSFTGWSSGDSTPTTSIFLDTDEPTLTAYFE